jgi:hypothetical protein
MSALDVSRHLYRFFPAHMNREVGVGAGSVAEVLRAINEVVHGFADYLLDEHGALHRHVSPGVTAG